MASGTGISWLARAVRPKAPITALIASTSGMPAISRPPKVTIRITSVIGSDSFSAWAKSLPWESLYALP